MRLDLLYDLIEQAKVAIEKSDSIDALESVRVKFLGKNGYINQQFKRLESIESYNKPKLGAAINLTKQNINNLLDLKKKKLELSIIEKSLNMNELDVTLPGRLSEIGTLHPITSTIACIKSFFNYLGFIEVYGPEIEDNYFNFDALNIPINHPARNKNDTFWFDSKHLLRTHTSGIQIRTLAKVTPPIRALSVGKVYRKDYDKCHTPMFHQMEGFVVDSDINLGNLKKILFDFLYDFFGKDIILRFRPSYFPFTNPSAEIDIMITENQKCNQNWLEVLGCGMIHPTVLRNVSIDPEKFSGLAFGIGIERLTMLFHNITDIRVFFENDLQFLNQFQ